MKRHSRRDELDGIFERINRLDEAELELRADFSRYLCVLVSGFVEQSYRNAVSQYVVKRSSRQVANFVIQSTSGLSNLNSEKLIRHLLSFDSNWKSKLDAIFVDELKDALNSVVALRHAIAHGQSADVTFARVATYYLQIKHLIDEIEHLFDIS